MNLSAQTGKLIGVFNRGCEENCLQIIERYNVCHLKCLKIKHIVLICFCSIAEFLRIPI